MKKLLILMVTVLMSACCSNPSSNHRIKHNVRAIPTLLVLDENNNLVRKVSGLPATPEDLTKFIYETN